MAEDDTNGTHRYELAVPKGADVCLRTSETRGNLAKIEAWLREVPPGQPQTEVKLGCTKSGVLCTKVPGHLKPERRPRLWISYHIDRQSDDVGDYCVKCEVTATGGTPLSNVIKGEFTDGTVLLDVCVELVKGCAP